VLPPIAKVKVDAPNVAVLGPNQPTSQKVFDRAVWK
jgi:hypothetical protein